VRRIEPPSDDAAWRCVLLAGPAGTGKTTMCRLGHRAMVEAWGHPAAAIDLDQLYANVDARWELPYDDTRNAMLLAQASQLAISLFEHGWRTVIVCGNSLFEPADTAPMLATLCSIAEIYHVTLTPRLDAVLGRCAAASHRDASRLRKDFQLHADKVHPGSARLDNTNMTAEQALAELARMVGSGAGRMRCSQVG
jgi:energy-coupling factor transporter ATP-binding protein EcfA2